jgi:glutamate-ammonia-ligase adenylyltransferase
MRMMLTPDLEELLRSTGFRDPGAARNWLDELAGDTAEMLALARLSGPLGESLHAAADPDAAINQLGRFVHARGGRLSLYQLFADHPVAIEGLIRLLGASPYLADVLVRNPEYFDILIDTEWLRHPRAPLDVTEELERTSAAFDGQPAQTDAVRRFRRRELLRIGAADLCGLHDLVTTTRQLSDLAAAVVAQCLQIVEGRSSGSDLIVLAMGKLGGGELNYSSDIDLVFVAPRADRLDQAVRLARSLTAVLGEPTAEGFLYRVDLRLRPFGESGAVVISSETFADYLASHAHPAELQAMLKARPIAGDLAGGRELLRRTEPVLCADGPTARRQVRELKERIERQLQTRGTAAGHVKLAPGGIRDIEFIVQALQLESVRERPELRIGNTLDALIALERAGVVSAADSRELADAYCFLRAVEHRLQLMNNQQVHHLPGGERGLAVLARSLAVVQASSLSMSQKELTGRLETCPTGRDESDAAGFRAAYDSVAAAVRRVFDRLLPAADSSPVGGVADQITPASIAAQIGPCYDQFTFTERDRHAELVASVREPYDVALHAARSAETNWRVTVSAGDCVGLLSLIAGQFSAQRIDIADGEVFTLRFQDRDVASSRGRPGGRRRRTALPVVRRILDIFDVTTPGPVDAVFWDGFRGELAELVTMLRAGSSLAARERIIDRVSAAASAAATPPAPLLPIAVELDNDSSPNATVLRIRSPNTIGFLFEFTSALAALNVNIERVQIRTVAGEVRDTFWVTDDRRAKIESPERLHELRVAAALIKQFTHLLPRSPNPAQALRQFRALAGELALRADWSAEVESLESEPVLRTLAEVMGVSEFLWEDFLRMQHESLFPVVQNVAALADARSKVQLQAELTRLLAAAADRDDRVRQLNQFKDREMFRVDLRHITRRVSFAGFSGELSDLAEVFVAEAAALCAAEMEGHYGPPRLDLGGQCRWCVCALGKFGGRELGYGSDIELLFVYDGPGSTTGPRCVANSMFFEEFVSAFLRSVIARREGIFEIDLRLRPYGKAGSLATPLAGFRDYFSEHGAAVQFERMALVKLRPVAGDGDLTARVLAARDAFVYSGRPLDRGNIVHLRRRQAAELVPTGCTSAKHSRGGLVDVEYYVQARQIECGVTDPTVRATNTLAAIDRLVAGGYVESREGEQLRATYGFLRRLIDALRVVRGHAKDLTIPAPKTREFAYLARRLGYGSEAELAHQIDRCMAFAGDLWPTT